MVRRAVRHRELAHGDSCGAVAKAHHGGDGGNLQTGRTAEGGWQAPVGYRSHTAVHRIYGRLRERLRG